MPLLLEGPVLEAARPADGLDERRSSPRSPRPRHFRRRVAQGDARPWAQILKWDLVGSALGIALFLLVYYAAAGFSTIYWSTVFKNPNGSNFSVAQANGLNQWFWGAEIVALIVVGFVSDKLKVRKPFMVVGAIGAIIFLILFLLRATHPYTQYSTLVFPGRLSGRVPVDLLRPVDGRLHRDGRGQEPRAGRPPGSLCGVGSCASSSPSRSSSCRS